MPPRGCPRATQPQCGLRAPNQTRGASLLLSADERYVRDAARGADRLDVEAFFQSLKSVPESFATPQDNGGYHNVHVIDQVCGEELTDVEGPPPIRTSSPPAASFAILSASAGVASMKWKDVPPFIWIVGLGLCVSTNTGV
jgi:hypothetical protein